jgi:hypothetical protein
MESKKVWKFSEVTPSDLKWAENREITATVDGNARTVTFSEEIALPSLEENWDVGTENDLEFEEV